MKEKRNTEWGEGQEKWSDRELLQLSFFPSIWRAQRKIGDEYGGSSSHSLLTFFSWIPSTLFFTRPCPFHSLYLFLTLPFLYVTFTLLFLVIPSLMFYFHHFCRSFFPPLSSVKLLITLQPPHLSFFINFLLISFIQSLKPPQPPLSLALSLILWHTFYSSSLHPLVHITISFFLLPCVCLFIYRPLPFLSCGYAVAGACVCVSTAIPVERCPSHKIN